MYGIKGGENYKTLFVEVIIFLRAFSLKKWEKCDCNLSSIKLYISVATS